MGWSGWDHDRVMLSTVRLTWCMMDTADGAGREVRGQGSGVRGSRRGCSLWPHFSGARKDRVEDQRGECFWLRPHSLPRGLMGAKGLVEDVGAAFMRHLQISDTDDAGHPWGAQATPGER